MPDSNLKVRAVIQGQRIGYALSQSWVPLPPGITGLPAAPAPVPDATYGEVLTPTALLRPYQESVRVDCVVKVQMTQRRLEYALTLPDQGGLMKVRARVIGSQHVGTFATSLATRLKMVLSMEEFIYSYDMVAKVNFSIETPATPPTLLLHFDGTNGSTTITDSSSNDWSMAVNGNAQLTTSDPKFGTAELTLDRSANTYIQTPVNAAFAIGTGDFTVDFWAKPNTTSGSDVRGLFTFGLDGGGGGVCLAVRFGQWRIGNTNSPGFQMAPAIAGSKVHVALTRSGTAIHFFLDGVRQPASDNYTWSDNFTNNQLSIGWANTISDGLFDGTIDEFRYIKGYAAWTSSFTPPTAAY